jgi:hypothetical protein
VDDAEVLKYDGKSLGKTVTDRRALRLEKTP